jgi:hypothetical protein
MSTKLVRKFLRNTSSDWKQPDDKPVKLSKKKRKLLEEEQGTPATEQDVLDMHVKSLLAVDRSIATQSKASSKKGPRKDSKRPKIESDFGVGNTRGSAAQSTAVHEPTFDKKRHAKQKKEKSLQKIARLLQKNAKSKQKA